jgi:hypothetical protein
VVSVVVSGLYAKRSFSEIKKAEIVKLEKKSLLIKKRLDCIKKSSSAKDIKICKAKNPLVEKKKSK